MCVDPISGIYPTGTKGGRRPENPPSDGRMDRDELIEVWSAGDWEGEIGNAEMEGGALPTMHGRDVNWRCTTRWPGIKMAAWQARKGSAGPNGVVPLTTQPPYQTPKTPAHREDKSKTTSLISILAPVTSARLGTGAMNPNIPRESATPHIQPTFFSHGDEHEGCIGGCAPSSPLPLSDKFVRSGTRDETNLLR